MERYKIYCTEEQTRKALELGAPIEYHPMYMYGDNDSPKIVHYKVRNIRVFSYCPTAEQLFGWLEEQEIHITITRSDDGFDVTYSYIINERYGDSNYTSRKEATLAAIDAALEYLTNKK